MRRIKKIRNKIVLHPIITFCILILLVAVISGILNIFNVSTSYNRISTSGTYVKEFVKSFNLFSLRGLKYVFSNAVSSFSSFAPLSTLIITMMGIGMMDKTGFLDSFFYILTKKTSKRMVTFVLSFVCILSSIAGDLSYIVFIPLSALLFKYGKRHPKSGIICAFASIACGTGVNIFMSSIDSALIEYTTLSAGLLTNDSVIGSFSYLFIMIAASLILALIISNITEKIIIPKLGHYELMDETEDYLTKKEKRALLISLSAGVLYIFFFIYNIIPYAPLGGNFLDYSQKFYIDKLFGYNTFFSQGFIFVVVLLFFILGLVYGINTKTIKKSHDVFECLKYSLDKIGKVLVLLFFASSFIFIFKKSNIGTLITAFFANLINTSDFVGIPLILLTFFVSCICTIFLPSTVSKWSILSSSVVPGFINSGLSPAFATLVFRAGECATYALTPLMAYFVIYLAFMELYSNDNEEGLFGNLKYLVPYSFYTGLMWLALIFVFYLIGLPLGIGTFAGL